MRITRKQLRYIIRESLNEIGDLLVPVEEVAYPDTGLDPGIVEFLTSKADGYHGDPALDIDGDRIPDAPAVRELLQDDFLDEFGHRHDIRDYAGLIEDLASQR